MLNDAPENEDWAAVGRAINERMDELGISATRLAEETGLSPMTLRHIGDPTKRRTKSTLVAISAVLEWHHNHLTNILHGEPQKNVPATSPLEPHFENLLRAEVGPVKEEMVGIRDIIHVIDKKIDVIIESQHSPISTAGPLRPAPGQPPEQVLADGRDHPGSGMSRPGVLGLKLSSRSHQGAMRDPEGAR